MKIKPSGFIITILFYFICLINPKYTFAQHSDSVFLQKNSISLEIGGNSFPIGSLNYERLFQISKKFYFSFRIGVGGFYNIMDLSSLTIPILGKVIYHVVNVFSLEAGFGSSLYFLKIRTSPEEVEFEPMLTGLIGIRLQHPKGFCFRAGFTPFAEFWSTDTELLNSNFKIIPFAGYSFGYSF